VTAAQDSGSPPRHRYLPLVYRVAGLNAVLLVAAVVVTATIPAFVREGSRLDITVSSMGNAKSLRGGVLVQTPEPTSEAGELSLTFNEMLTRLEAERREATGRVLAGQEAERLRIARELHDQVGQELTAVLLGLARVQARLEPPLREDVSDVQEAVRSSLDDVRRIALELRPEALDDLGLVSALAVLCERFAQRSGLDVSQRIDEPLPALDPDAELVIYRVAQEALTNVARHSGAARARLSLDPDGSDGLLMTVTDDGHGMPAGAQPGTGIRGMLERAALIGARLELTPGPDGRGSTVALRIALAREAGAAA